MTAETTTVSPYADAFARLEAADGAPAWLRALRRRGFDRFKAAGFPGRKHEEWRHMDLSPVTGTSFATADGARAGTVSAKDIEPLRLKDEAARIVLVDGRHAPAHSAAAAAKGLTVRSIREALATEPAAMEAHLGRHAELEGRAFTALNTAFVSDGAFVEIAPGAAMKAPIHIIHYSTAPASPAVVHARTLVVAGARSECHVVETFAGADGGVRWTNAVAEIVAGEAAVVEHTRLQLEPAGALHLSEVQYDQARDAQLRSNAITFGAALSRTDIDARLGGEGAFCTLDGLFVLGGKQFSDTHTRLDHAVPNCGSRELYKGILDGKARGVFDGLILVRDGALKTDAKQTNKNLLLSREALVDSNPRLEIYADDVKCTHGSTIGQLDPEQVFYLTSRGIGEDTARALLTHAFARDVTRSIGSPEIRSRLDALLFERLPGGRHAKGALAADV